MRRLPPKGPEPTQLHDFRRDNRESRDWDFFYNNYPSVYQALKERIFIQQGYLCAYCEVKIPKEKRGQQRIEHFHPKSHNDPHHNWTFDWNNMVGVCTGTDSGRGRFNCHCDASKEIYVTPEKCEGFLLNPLTMPHECLFDIEHDTGKLIPNQEVCSRARVPDNAYSSVLELVKKTITILNLNCDTLNQKRRLVILEFEKQRNNLRRNPHENKSSVREKIAKRWFQNNTPSFYTTRRILLGKYAEDIIREQCESGN